ncbi:thioredoxin domain-containing protein 6 isoform X1 [Cyanistes caeruleus]|uniref:thioredoxin domain-containing protein 6 isoform X1 n=2 Tax=Cyanistes caeruleus TaxID=156563 RepID=UPI000CDB2DD7|nr:thioredoxin domain-containing protein 6 isoform X1 [Cyanistes caeruleus]XP_023789181.1 thioredoxin domain-containing protein 6 isoform X1 [Cyanistes caeruleus]
MAAKKKEVVLQINITSQELWEEMLCLKGLIVVDVFQAWCGPCKPVVNLFQKVRNEVGSNLLHFAVAEADSIDALEKYRGQWRRISGCCKRSRCTIAAEDHPETADRTFSRDQGSTAPLQEEQREGLTGKARHRCRMCSVPQVGTVKGWSRDSAAAGTPEGPFLHLGTRGESP